MSREDRTLFGNRRAAPQKHLYLVVDDWERGYSVYKVSDASSSLQEAPLVRIEAQHCSWFLAGHGTRIFAMNPAESSPGIPVFDTATLGLAVCNDSRTRGVCGRKPVYASVGDNLLAFAYPYVDVLVGPAPRPTEQLWHWSFKDEPPVTPPFASNCVSGYAVHPDGRTVFMSVSRYRPNPGNLIPFYGDRSSTYAFDVETREFTYVSEWVLPFRGQAYYDAELDAWVGLYLYNEQEGVGRVCCCDVVPPDATDMPAWKLGVDVLFEHDDLHSGATLVYMGGDDDDDSKFCLVELRYRAPADEGEDVVYPRPRFRDVSITSFTLKYDKEGDLRTGRRRGYASMWYQLHHQDCHTANDQPVAFWM